MKIKSNQEIKRIWITFSKNYFKSALRYQEFKPVNSVEIQPFDYIEYDDLELEFCFCETIPSESEGVPNKCAVKRVWVP